MNNWPLNHLLIYFYYTLETQNSSNIKIQSLYVQSTVLSVFNQARRCFINSSFASLILVAK